MMYIATINTGCFIFCIFLIMYLYFLKILATMIQIITVMDFVHLFLGTTSKVILNARLKYLA